MGHLTSNRLDALEWIGLHYLLHEALSKVSWIVISSWDEEEEISVERSLYFCATCEQLVFKMRPASAVRKSLSLKREAERSKNRIEQPQSGAFLLREKGVLFQI